MAAPAAVLSPRAAVEKVQTLARRAGAAWNKHDRAFANDTICAARDSGARSWFGEYGCVRVRVDFAARDDGAATTKADAVIEVGIDDVAMGEGQPPSRPATTHDEDAQPAVAQPQEPAAQQTTSASVDPQVAHDIKVACTARERRKRQKANKKQREQQRLAELEKAEQLVAAEALEPKQFCPLWSTTLGQRDAFVRLLGEVSTRITQARGPTTPSTRSVQVEFRGQLYQVLVFKRTSACTMTAKERGDEMVAMLASGITEERVTALLTRWSLAATPNLSLAASAAAS